MTREEYKDKLLNEPTPHSAYIQNLEEDNAYRLLNSIKSQAMKDYINALSKLRYDPHNVEAEQTIKECEDLFDDYGKMETVKQKVKFDGGMFEIICMENFPDTWGEKLPTKGNMVKCPICKEGRINRSFRPIDPSIEHREKKDPRIIYSCDVCTYKYVIHPWKTGDEQMKRTKEQLHRASLRERDRLFKLELEETLAAHPEYTQADIDETYRRLSRKWKI